MIFRLCIGRCKELQWQSASETSPSIQKVHSLVGILISRTQPDINRIGQTVYLLHERDLTLALAVIVLIDTYRVDPDCNGTEGFAYMTQSLIAVLSDFYITPCAGSVT